jgi:uncharacterized protein HemX
MTETQAKKAVHAELATRAFVLVLLAVFALTAWGVYLIRNQQVQNLTTLKSAQSAAADAKNTAESIKSCTTPGLKCYERSQKQLAHSIADLTTGNQRAASAAAACAAGLSHPDFATVYRCVLATLKPTH